MAKGLELWVIHVPAVVGRGCYSPAYLCKLSGGELCAIFSMFHLLKRAFNSPLAFCFDGETWNCKRGFLSPSAVF